MGKQKKEIQTDPSNQNLRSLKAWGSVMMTCDGCPLRCYHFWSIFSSCMLRDMLTSHCPHSHTHVHMSRHGNIEHNSKWHLEDSGTSNLWDHSPSPYHALWSWPVIGWLWISLRKTRDSTWFNLIWPAKYRISAAFATFSGGSGSNGDGRESPLFWGSDQGKPHFSWQIHSNPPQRMIQTALILFAPPADLPYSSELAQCSYLPVCNT